MPINKSKYPPGWSERRKRVLLRSGGIKNIPEVKATCEKCGVVNYSYHPETGSEVILTVAHLDHDAENWDVLDNRLMAMCQKCHNNYDKDHRIKNRKKKKEHLQLTDNKKPKKEKITSMLYDGNRRKNKKQLFPVSCRECDNILPRESAIHDKSGYFYCEKCFKEKELLK